MPSQDDYGQIPGETIPSEKQAVSDVLVTNARVPKTVKSGEHGESFEFGKGNIDDDGEDGQLHPPNDGGDIPEPNPGPTPNPDNDTTIGPGDKDVLKKVNLIKTDSRNNNVAFSILAIPVLALCLQEIKTKQYEEIEDIVDGRSWFNAVRSSFQREKGKPLTIDELEQHDAFELAQLVLNNASCRGLEDFTEGLIGNDGSSEDEEVEV